MREFLADQDWLQVDYLPAYAPELNPVEGLWANLKGGELANRCCQTAEEVIATAQVGMIGSAGMASCRCRSCGIPA